MSIKTQADVLIQKTNLLDVLRRHGIPFITGSYFMNTMAWNDLDLYLQPGVNFDPYAMAAELNAALRPFRFEGFVNENGTFYGCETSITGERWNIDLWIRNAEKIEESIAYCNDLLKKMDRLPGSHEAILSIKTELIQRGMYGFDKHPSRHYHSQDIYSAVLNDGVRSTDEFLHRYPL